MNKHLQPPWHTERRLLETRLSPRECHARLAPHVASGFAFYPNEPVRGSVSPGGFTLSKTIHHRNSFQPQASGSFEPTAAGTRIHIDVRMSPIVTIFMCIWLVVVGGMAAMALFGLIVAIASVAGNGSENPLALPILLGFGGFAMIPVLMLLFGVGLLAFGRWFARDETDFLMRFLSDTLEAHELSSTPTG